MPPRSLPKLPFKELPEFLRKHIQLPDGQEKSGCWIWTGRTQPARQKFNRYPASDRPELREHQGRFGRERETPKSIHPLTTKDVDAHRLVFSFATCTAIEDIPRLKRCSDDLCVSPYHTTATVTATISKRKLHQPEPDPEPEAVDYTHDRCFDLLKGAGNGEGVSRHIGRLLAADEAGIPAEQLTEATWGAYVKWDEENDPDDD